ncbi:hypothetical protein AgCh_021009 [Apium graveolens]
MERNIPDSNGPWTVFFVTRNDRVYYTLELARSYGGVETNIYETAFKIWLPSPDVSHPQKVVHQYGHRPEIDRCEQYDFKKSSKNDHESHENWFFISGPKITKYAQWREVDLAQVVIRDLEPQKDNDYVALSELDIG